MTIKSHFILPILSLWVLLVPASNLKAQETDAEKAARLMPPVIQSMSIPDMMQAETAHTLTWSVLGYHSGYKTIIAFFDCTGETDCGANASDPSLITHSGKLDPVSSVAGNWEYLGVPSTLFNYSYDFTPPAVDETTDIVIRFYQINDDDNGLFPTISLTVPGDIATKYDNSGRRISKTITSAPAAPPAAPKLPDTGQTTSYTTVFGEDADYPRNPQSFTDNGDGTVTDNNTTLMWQQGIAAPTTWDAAGTYCSNLSTGGYNDWRLPDPKELKSIVNHDNVNPSIDTTYFPGTANTWYWSSTTFVQSSSSAWMVHFGAGVISQTSKAGGGLYVRCVRSDSGSTLWAFDFVDNSDGTVSHGNTGLMWQQVTASPRSWEAAISYCENLGLASFSDWRLPNVNELHTIVDYGLYAPSIDTSYFPGTASLYYWSSTASAYNTSYAWRVLFSYGYVGDDGKADSGYVRCVRSGQ